jgi:hypothetical protein
MWQPLAQHVNPEPSTLELMIVLGQNKLCFYTATRAEAPFVATATCGNPWRIT